MSERNDLRFIRFFLFSPLHLQNHNVSFTRDKSPAPIRCVDLWELNHIFWFRISQGVTITVSIYYALIRDIYHGHPLF